MSADFYGWIEFRDAELDAWDGEVLWSALANAGFLVQADIVAGIGLLFGVRNSLGFPPLAEGRGLPDDASEGVRQAIAEIPPRLESWTSYVTLAEIKAADLNSELVYTRIHRYERQVSSELNWLGSARANATDAPAEHAESESWEADGFLFKREHVHWREFLSGSSGVPLVIEIMETVAKRYGDDCVRLVGWFR